MRRTLGRSNLGLFLGATLIVTGCASLRPYDPGPGRRAEAGFVQNTFVAGDRVNVTIANLSDVMLFYPDSFCKTELQRKEQGGWLTVVPPAKSCPAQLDFLDPGQTVVHQFRLPSGVAGGTYRLALPMPLPEDATAPEPHLLTPSFTVEGEVAAATPASVTSNSTPTVSTHTPKDR